MNTTHHRSPAEPLRMLPRRRCLAAILLVASAALLPAPLARGQAIPSSTQAPGERPFEGGSTAVHLVGHEEAELLRRIQDVIDDDDPRKLRNPYVETVSLAGADGKPITRKVVRRSDLVQFIADADAAEALGKAFFWEMQAGSDFRRQRKDNSDQLIYVGTACASCHYRFGADARDTNTTRIPTVAWKGYTLDPQHEDLGFGEKQQDFDITKSAVRQIKDRSELLQPRARVSPPPTRRRAGDEDDDEAPDDDDDRRPRTPLSLIVGSQGVEPRVFLYLKAGNKPTTVDPQKPEWWSEHSEPRDPGGFLRKPDWAMFLQNQNPAKKAFRQITTRNSPSVFNAGFADRLFHDVRAESTFNGFSIFGDFDPREVIHVRRVDAKGQPTRPVLTHVAIPRAALASQAVGPIVNDLEMSYVGRTFHDLAAKLLDAPVLHYQKVAKDDSHLGRYREVGDDPEAPGLGVTYRTLIRRAFRREWWDGTDRDGKEQPVPLRLSMVEPDVELPTGTLMDANFSLYWGLSLMLYQATLVSNESPYDQMLRGQPAAVEAMWERKRKELEPILLDRVHNPARRPDDCDTKADPKAPPQPDATAPRFVLKSGAEVFQRGLRAFRSRGCIDCHDGPLFSEIYHRAEAAEVDGLKSLPIGRQVHNTLLPNARADSITFVYENVRNAVLDRIFAVITEADGTRDKPVSDRERQDLAALFGRLGGHQIELTKGVADFLRRARLAPRAGETPSDRDAREGKIAGVSATVARAWTTFEKTFATRLGDRPFFREEARVAFASILAEPLLIERMAIPPNQAATRPPFPTSWPAARGPYAFYDTSVYALGVAPPRYDRGLGNWTKLPDPEDRRPPEYTPAILRAFEKFLDELTDEVKKDGATEQSLAKEGETRIEAFDRETRRDFGLLMPERVRRRVRAALNPQTGVALLADLKQQVVAMRELMEAPVAADPAAKEAKAKVAAGTSPIGQPTRAVPSRHPAANGAPGQAYQLTTQSRALGGDGPESAPPFMPRADDSFVYGPWESARDADAADRVANPRDLTWFRDLPLWEEDPRLKLDEHKPQFDNIDARRVDFHTFSRARELVQDESPQGRRKPFMFDAELAFWGAFKTPTLRNVDLTPPYMHNGRLQSLFEVLDFYARGGDVPAHRDGNPDRAPAMVRLHMDEEEKLAIVFFLMCLTDDRVERERAPFDHPALVLVNGYGPESTGFAERTFSLQAIGAGGRKTSIPARFPSGVDDPAQP